MKATGIIRRLDELGRIVIPKEIRRVKGIAEGDPLEIFVEDDKIIFAKYRPEDGADDCKKCDNGLLSPVDGSRYCRHCGRKLI